MGQQRPPTHRKTAADESSAVSRTDWKSSPRQESEELVSLDIVDDASEDSFPASDPPNWATGQQRDPSRPESGAEPE